MLFAGENEIGPDFGEWLEDEAARGHPRMGKDEGRCLHAQGIGIEQIKVDGAGTVFRMRCDAAGGGFVCSETRQQGCGCQGGFDFHHGVEERGGVGGAIDGFRFVESGAQRGEGSFVQGREEVPRGDKVRGAVAEIGAEGDASFHALS